MKLLAAGALSVSLPSMTPDPTKEINIPLTSSILHGWAESAALSAQRKGGNPGQAHAEAIYFGLRNCIRTNNTACLSETLSTVPCLDLDADFGMGSLLLFAASLPILTQSEGTTLAPLRILLRHHANPLALSAYRLSETAPEGNATAVRRDSLVTYLSHIVKHIAGKEPDDELAELMAGKTNNVIDSIIYIKGQLIEYDPELVLGTPLIGLRRRGLTSIREPNLAKQPGRTDPHGVGSRELALVRASNAPKA